MTRLSEPLRMSIMHNWIRIRASKVYDALEEQVVSFAYKVWEHNFGEYKDSVYSLPKGTITAYDDIKFSPFKLKNPLYKAVSFFYNHSTHYPAPMRRLHTYTSNSLRQNSPNLQKQYFKYPFPTPILTDSDVLVIPVHMHQEAIDLQQLLNETGRKFIDAKNSMEVALAASSTDAQILKQLPLTDKAIVQKIIRNNSKISVYRYDPSLFDDLGPLITVVNRNPKVVNVLDYRPFTSDVFEKLKDRGVIDQIISTISPSENPDFQVTEQDGRLIIRVGDKTAELIYTDSTST